MMRIFTIEDLEKQAQSVKTLDNHIWINLTDGRFMRYDTSLAKQPICLSSVAIYPKIKTVMAQKQVIASKHPKEQQLKWQVNKQLA